ncbi:metal-dependent hydrolase [Motilimonas sp. 1_MG-2023]|uniref:metal-dependent hydrolase n=1 Tax=Motilimonas sp. 1_MG-2023 TaxID=3062672 RepID=UPI0026E27345|nr:metal-dependent hydrolase [Motilimonas sp. 1_MG-2023]MDO6526050.1 metal-dependent hydrolase [Motilimonas sp. 1_MG-2023]
MDSVTQIALGASVAAAIGFKPFGKKVLLTGALLGTLPDMDVLVNYGDDIANYTSHRGFSHSLFVLTALSGVFFLLARQYWQSVKEHPWAGFLVIWLVLITHPLLDSFTTYGTQIWWPLTSPPVSWSSVFIIDPLYTLPLLVAIIGLAISKRPPRWQKINIYALTFSCLYLAAGQFSKWQVQQQLSADEAAGQQIFVAPTPFNILAWRVLRYQQDSYAEGFTYVFNSHPIHWQHYRTGRQYLNQYQSAELERLEWFSQGLLMFSPLNDQLQVTDLRLGMGGYYPFSFAIAQSESNSNLWQTMAPIQLPPPTADFSQLVERYKNIAKANPSNDSK